LRLERMGEVSVHGCRVPPQRNSQNNQPQHGSSLRDGEYILNQLPVTEAECVAEGEQRDHADGEQLRRRKR